MPAFKHIKLSDRLACQGSVTIYGVLRAEDLLTAGDMHAIDELESLRFSYARVDQFGAARAINAHMRAGRVLIVAWDDGSFDEWRVRAVSTGRGEGGKVEVEAVSLLLDLAERADAAGRGWVSEVSGGERIFDYEIAERTASSILSTYVIANAPSYITLGTVDPSVTIPAVSVTRLTPLALAYAVRDSLRAMDVSCELRLRRNGTTNYKLDLLTQIGSSANTPVFHPNVALLSLKQRTDPALQATRMLVHGGTAPDTFPGVLGRARWRGGTPSGLVIALTDRNGGSSPIAFDNQWVNAYLLRVKTGRTFKITGSNAAAGTVTLETTVSTIAVNEDFEFRLTEPFTNTRTTTTRYAISAVGGSTITCAASNPLSVDDQYIDWYARVWSASSGGTIILTTRISDTTATDVLTVASIAGVTTSHFVEFVQLDGAGEVPAYVDHPTYIQADPTGYGVKVGELTRANNLGITQLVPNSWMRTWTNSANPPDGWTRTMPANIVWTRSSTTTRFGGFSQKFERTAAGTGTQFEISSPIFYPNFDPGHNRLSARAWIYFDNFLVVASNNYTVQFEVRAATAAGASGTLLGSVVIQPTNGAVSGTMVATGTWVELRVEGITLLPTSTPYGALLTVIFGSAANTTDLIGYLDTGEAYPFMVCPDASYEFGDATVLTQTGNRKLEEVASPPVEYTIQVRDLERAFPVEYARLATTVGGNIRAADVEYGIDVTIRLLRRERNLLKPTETTFVLANRPTRLTDLVQAGVTKPTTDPTTALVSWGGAAAVLTAPTMEAPPLQSFAGVSTIPGGYEVNTPASAPVLTVDPGAGVTYVPTTPTSPTTGVTVATTGASPRPRPALK